MSGEPAHDGRRPGGAEARPAGRGPAGRERGAGRGRRPPPDDTAARDPDAVPCLRCGLPLPVRRMGCRGGHCPNCGHPYPHGDCSD